MDTTLACAAQNQDLGLRICEHVNTHEVLGLWPEVEDTVIDVYAQEANVGATGALRIRVC